MSEATWAQIGINGIGTALHKITLPWQSLMTKMLLTHAGLGIFILSLLLSTQPRHRRWVPDSNIFLNLVLQAGQQVGPKNDLQISYH